MMNGYATAIAKDADQFVEAMSKQMAPSDREILRDSVYREAFIRDLREAYRQGTGGHVVDSSLAMTSRDWGFILKEIKVPVFLWQGTEDTLVSPNMARHLAAEIPDCTANYVEGAGHLITENPEVVKEVKPILVARAV